jgi:hypothetical protein
MIIGRSADIWYLLLQFLLNALPLLAVATLFLVPVLLMWTTRRNRDR